MYAVLHLTSWPLSVNDTSAVHSPCAVPGARVILKSPCPPAPVQVPAYLPAGVAKANANEETSKLETRMSFRMGRNSSKGKQPNTTALESIQHSAFSFFLKSRIPVSFAG